MKFKKTISFCVFILFVNFMLLIYSITEIKNDPPRFLVNKGIFNEIRNKKQNEITAEDIVKKDPPTLYYLLQE